MLMSQRVFSFGDRVVHTGKPEWGAGLVTAANKTTHEGKPCQSLTIRFDRAGVKTISTAFATLIPASEAGSLPTEPIETETTSFGGKPMIAKAIPSSSAAEADFAAKLAGGDDLKGKMTKLPEPATDPFTGPVERLKYTLGLYRFTPTGGSLLDWAAMQSGLADPMSRFNRHELERFFESFVVVRDQHLKKVVFEARKADPAGTARAVSAAPANVQQLVRRLDATR